jgi:hypothetical protein
MIRTDRDDGVLRTICGQANWHPRPIETDIRSVGFEESDVPEADYVTTVRVAHGDRRLGTFLRDHADCGSVPEVRLTSMDEVWEVVCQGCSHAIRLHTESLTGERSQL